jgi:ATP-dependent DNA helicase RecG
MVSADTPLRGIVGAKTSSALESAFGLATVGDLLGYYPRRLDDRGALTDLSDLKLGEHVTVLAKTVKVEQHKYQPKSGGRMAFRTEVVVTDGTRQLLLTFFRQPWRKGQLEAGTVGMFSGKVGEFRRQLQLTQPAFDFLGRDADLDEFDVDRGRRWWPIYPASAQLTSKKIMDSVALVLDAAADLPDPVPASVRMAQGLIPYADALRQIHQPADPADWAQARRRLKFDEAFHLQTVLALRRRELLALPALSRERVVGALTDRFDAQLPFTLTAGQRVVGDQIEHDLGQTHPMHRLLQGEVGSGKTVVAVRAMLQVVDAGGQAALLAPTEVLAAQHHRSIAELLGPMAEGGMLTGAADATRVALITGSMSAARRREALLDAQSGSAGIVIGTHALLEDIVQFADLGLVVVDEQHRFGVEQRAALTGKTNAEPPHVLVMTATPIPRTVAMTVFGDLEVSTLREIPAGRRPIQTNVVPLAEHPGWMSRVWERVREEVSKGHQVYVVCPRIGGDDAADPDGAVDRAPDGEPDEDSENAESRRPPLAVLDVAQQLSAGPLAGLRQAVLHGRLPGDEKDATMRAFAAGDTDVLVSTTVVEVGVDVANASAMVVLDADRFGVSQLHQLRGRVGRGEVDGICLLVTDAPAESASRERLDGVAATTDGFELAKLDLETRREGDVLGAAQSGTRSSLRLLSVLRDADVIEAARATADDVVGDDPDLSRHPALRAEVARLQQTEQSEFLEKS